MAEVAFRQLRKQYPPRRGSAAVEVLKGIDLEVRDGEFLVLVGPRVAARARCCGFWLVGSAQSGAGGGGGP